MKTTDAEKALTSPSPAQEYCTMGVGCDDVGVCFAEAHGQPEQCSKSQEAGAEWPEPKITNPDIGKSTGVAYLDCLLHRILDAQQDINIAANAHMSQSLCDASALIGEVETAIRRLSSPAQEAGADDEDWDGLDCSCGGGWKVGHRAGCPEAAQEAGAEPYIHDPDLGWMINTETAREVAQGMGADRGAVLHFLDLIKNEARLLTDPGAKNNILYATQQAEALLASSPSPEDK